MRDKIDERDLQDSLRRSIIKSYNVHYMTVEDLAEEKRNPVIVGGNSGMEEVSSNKKPKKVELEGYPEYDDKLPPSSYYGQNEADEETLNRMAEIMKDKEAAVKELFH